MCSNGSLDERRMSCSFLNCQMHLSDFGIEYNKNKSALMNRSDQVNAEGQHHCRQASKFAAKF